MFKCTCQGPFQKGSTPLMKAAFEGHAECITTLLSAETPEARQERLLDKDTNDMTPLMWAAEMGEADCAKILLLAAAETGCIRKHVCAQCVGGSTPLMRAALNGHMECIEVLLQAGFADEQVVMNDGETALMRAVGREHERCVSLLLKYNPREQVLAVDEEGLICLWHADSNHVKLLLAHSPGEQILWSDKNGCTILMATALSGSTDSVWHILHAASKAPDGPGGMRVLDAALLARDHEGLRAIDFARKGGCEEFFLNAIRKIAATHISCHVRRDKVDSDVGGRYVVGL